MVANRHGGTHPFRPQSSPGAEEAIAILEREVDLGSHAIYEDVRVEESARGQFNGYPLGGSTKREAAVVVRENGATYEAVVSLTDQKVLSFGRSQADASDGSVTSEPGRKAESTEVV